MGILEWNFYKYCKVCKRTTDWKGYNDNDDTGDQYFCTEHEDIAINS